MVVYIVTEGIYSAYHIERVFDNLEDAKKYYNILAEEETNNPIIEVYNVGWISEARDTEVYSVSHDVKFDDWTVRNFDYVCGEEYHSKEEDVYSVMAKDEAHALKIAQDRHAAWKAVQEGIA